MRLRNRLGQRAGEVALSTIHRPENERDAVPHLAASRSREETRLRYAHFAPDHLALAAAKVRLKARTKTDTLKNVDFRKREKT